MITRIWFKRTAENEPVLCLATDVPNQPSDVITLSITEMLYDQWVPDSRHLHGESLSEGVIWEKPLIPNLKGEREVVHTEYQVAYREDGIYRIPNHVGDMIRIVKNLTNPR